MKKFFFIGTVLLALAAGTFGVRKSNQSSDSALTPLQLENLDALTQDETECTNPNGYRRIQEGDERIYDCCYIQQVGKGKEDCKRW